MFGWVVTGCGVAAVTTGVLVAGSRRAKAGVIRVRDGGRLHHYGQVFRNRHRVPALNRNVRRCSRHDPILGNGRNGAGDRIVHAQSSLRRHRVCARRQPRWRHRQHHSHRVEVLWIICGKTKSSAMVRLLRLSDRGVRSVAASAIETVTGIESHH